MKLILFFNGWGMDNSSVKNLIVPDKYQLKIINFPYNVEDINFEIYQEIAAIGWSFGCYYLARFVLTKAIKFKYIISLNGTSEPVGENGISPKMFDLTLNTLTPNSLLKFYNNMGIPIDFTLPDKSFCEIKGELRHFKKEYIPLPNVFTHAIVGKKDKIINGTKVAKYYRRLNIPVFLLETTHFLFKEFTSWNEILSLVKGRIE